MAAQPDALFIVGDLVDEGSAADFALAKDILDAGLADATFPWYYVPGNHEVMGSSIQNFEDAQLGGFAGAPSGHVDIAGTRFIALNTADGTLSSDFSQLQMLRQQLDDAATNPDVTGVVLVQHMPIDDPNVNKQSQLGNRLDANMERDWMEEFRATSGKSLAMVNGHVGNFSAKRDDGIPYVINGNSGKNPTQVDQGAFLGWTMLGIDPDEGGWQANGKGVIEENTDWFIAETHVWADSVTLDGISETLPAGTQRTLTGTVQQNATTSAPLAWPMSVEVTGSAGVFVGDLADAPATAIAAVDPATLQLTALHAGSGTVIVSVGDASATQSFTVSGGDATVTGDAEVGSILTAQLGDWAQGRQVSYQLLRDGEAIADATSATY